jgi:hypothetical protein
MKKKTDLTGEVTSAFHPGQDAMLESRDAKERSGLKILSSKMTKETAQ